MSDIFFVWSLATAATAGIVLGFSYLSMKENWNIRTMPIAEVILGTLAMIIMGTGDPEFLKYGFPLFRFATIVGAIFTAASYLALLVFLRMAKHRRHHNNPTVIALIRFTARAGLNFVTLTTMAGGAATVSALLY
jgi:hypothetical protein